MATAEIATPASEQISRPKFPLETRVLQAADGEHEFEFLVIDKPEKWEPAKNFQFQHEIRVKGTSRVLSLPLRGISYREWNDIENQHPIPEWNQATPEPPNGDPEFRERKEKAVGSRQVVLLETVTGFKVPGEKIEEKVHWLDRLGSGEADSLFYQILEHNSNMADGSSVDNYRHLISTEKVNLKTHVISGFDDLLSASLSGGVFNMQRPFENYLIEFPLRQFPQSKKKEIEDQCRDPLPPQKPGKNPTTGQVDPMFPVYNWEDPRFQEAQRNTNRRRMILTLDAILPFEIPGDSIDAKYEWLGARLLGDVHRLWKNIQQEVVSYRNRFDFFING